MPKSKKPFKKAYLEITSQCNLDCSFCPKTSRPPQFITIEQFDYLLGQVQPLTNFVYLHLMGEPLLHPQLDRLLELCAQRGLKVSLTTNGTLLHRWQQQLLQSPALYRVSISLHSFEANRTGQSLEEYLSKALEFCRAASDLDRTYCVLRLWNKDSAVLKAENQRNVDIFEQVRRFFCLQEDPQKLLETKASIQLCRRVYLEMAEKFAWPDIERIDRLGVLLWTARPIRRAGRRHRRSLLPGQRRQYPAGKRLSAAAGRNFDLSARTGAPRRILLPPSHRGTLPPVRLCPALFHPLTFCFSKHHPLLQAL